MSESYEYVSPEYQAELDELAESLAASRRQSLAQAALQDTVEFPVIRPDMYFSE